MISRPAVGEEATNAAVTAGGGDGGRGQRKRKSKTPLDANDSADVKKRPRNRYVRFAVSIFLGIFLLLFCYLLSF